MLCEDAEVVNADEREDGCAAKKAFVYIDASGKHRGSEATSCCRRFLPSRWPAREAARTRSWKLLYEHRIGGRRK